MSNSQIDVDVLWVKPTIIATSARRYNFDAALSKVPFRVPSHRILEEELELARDPPPPTRRLVLSVCEPTTRSSGGRKNTTSDRHDPSPALLPARNTNDAAYWSGILKASVNGKPCWRTLVQRIADLLDEIPLIRQILDVFRS
jgi:hypothetical protein